MRIITTFIILLICISTSAQKATYYADRIHGRLTASGEVYDRNKLTCAHNSYPFGTILKVTNKSNGKSVVVKVNDRGKFGKGVSVDLSYEAAKRIDMIRQGKVNVTIKVIRENNKSIPSINN